MQSSGFVPRSTVDVDDLAGLFRHGGPFATVYLTTDAEVPNAAQLSEARWRAVREELVGLGAPEAVAAAVDPVVAEAHLRGRGLTAVATGGGLLLAESHPEPPARDVVRWGPLPALGTLVEWRQSSPPHLVVLADRQGADLLAFRGRRPTLVAEVDPGLWPVSKVQSGGWSQRHHHLRVEENWQHTADRVAEELVRMAAAIAARLIIVAGDVRAVEKLRASLPGDLGDRVRHIAGSRGVDGSADDIADRVVRQVATAVAEDTTTTLRTFRQESGQHDRAADGPAATVRALAMAQVGMLLFHDDPADDRTAWFGPEPAQVGGTADEVAAMGVDRPEQGRLIDLALRAAVGTGAEVRAVPHAGGPVGGLGAILRWG